MKTLESYWQVKQELRIRTRLAILKVNLIRLFPATSQSLSNWPHPGHSPKGSMIHSLHMDSSQCFFQLSLWRPHNSAV